MLIVTLRNLSHDLPEVSDYEYAIYVNRSCIASGKVYGHHRSEGWQALLVLLTKQSGEQELRKSPPE